jgi:uncharacterized protein
MKHLLIIVFFGITLSDCSTPQKSDTKHSNNNFVSPTKAEKGSPFKDSIVRKKIAKVYGDSALIIIDSLQNDSLFLKTFGDISTWELGEFVSTAYKIQFPIKPLGWVSDYENVFTDTQIKELDSILTAFERETSNEIAVVTIESYWTTTDKFDSLILSIHNTWGVGKKETNNGILIGFSKGLRCIRISNGYGIETKLTDSQTKNILDEKILPKFKEDNYFEGLKSGILAIMNKIR